ncbi:MAG TPA: hypothetical protein VEK76_02050 [Candidatus Binatia bacterium]|nr:hypothetical protein [Candidatus Binatia bacterium]
MTLAGQILRFHAPGVARRRALRELLQVTADAFGVISPSADGSVDELLQRYAAFTAEQAKAALRSGRDLRATRRALYVSTFGMGGRLRQQLGVKSAADVMVAARAVYRVLGIDLRGTIDGEIRIERCYFSRLYSAPVCDLISTLDQGLLAGLSGGGRLEFRQRITEGAPRCLATLTEVSL